MLKLRLLTGPRAGRQLRVSDTKPVSVGRRVGRLRLHDSRVSKKHAQIYYANGTWVLRDLGSANGTFVNQRRCPGLIELETGDVLQMGRVLIKILQADAVGMHAPRKKPDTTGTQASDIGVDAFTASGATGVLPAIDPGAPETEPQTQQAAGDDIDIAALLADDSVSSDLIDFSEQSKSGEGPSGAIDSESTQVSEHEQIELEPIEEDDPLLADESPAEPSTPDLVEIQDEQPSDTPKMPGTTILAALQEVEDDKPPMVGLRLDQPPPMQPPAAEEPESEQQSPTAEAEEVEIDGAAIEAEAEVEPVMAVDIDPVVAEPDATDAQDECDVAADAPIELEAQADDSAEDAAVASEPTAIEDSPAPAVVDEAAQQRARDASLTDTEGEASTDAGELDIETAHAELAFEDVVELAPVPLDPVSLAAELWPDEVENEVEEDSAVEPEAAAEPSSEIDNDAVEAADTFVEAETQAEPEAESESEPEAESQPEAATEAAEVADILASDETSAPTDEPEATDIVEPADELGSADAASSADELETEPTFDIDAAFDALSEGLDDSMVLPAITDASAAEPEPSAEQADALHGEVDVEIDEEVDEEVDDVVAEFDAELDSDLDIKPLTAAELDQAIDADLDPPTDIEPQPAEEAESLDEIESPDEPAPVDLAEDETEPEAEPVPEGIDADAFAGSQLDIDFIREALAKLGDEDPQAPAEPAAESADAAASADAPDSDDGAWLPTAEAEDHDAVRETAAEPIADAEPAQSATPIAAPPGLNPTTLLPPAEAARSTHSTRKGSGYWLFTLFSLLIIAGLSGALVWVYTNSDQIAGRPSQPDTPDGADQFAQTQPPAGTGQPTTTVPPVDPTNTTPPGDTARDTPIPSGNDDAGDNTAIAGSAPVPDLFAEGPGVLGSRALEGMTVRDVGGELPVPTPRDRPDKVIEPRLPGSDGTDTPATPRDPSPLDPPTIDPDPDGTATIPPPLDPPTGTDPVVPTEEPARLVFLVDASGSLVDTLPQMLVWLSEAVETIKPEERFTVIFFKAGRAIETSEDGLQRPGREVIDALKTDWLNPEAAPVLPTGRSNPATAIAAALAYKPTDLYLLSDESFARFTGGTTRDEAVKLVVDALGDADVKLHGVQFFYKDEGGVLETLANRYDGTFEFVKEAVIKDGDPIDLLEELDGGGE